MRGPFGHGYGAPGGPWGRRRGQFTRLLEPGVLHLLATQPQLHGYRLMEELARLGLSDGPIDPGAVYRTLRQLEREGCVASTWDVGGSGPARRVYVITPLGRERLRGWAEIIRKRAEALARFAEELQRGQSQSEQ